MWCVWKENGMMTEVRDAGVKKERNFGIRTLHPPPLLPDPVHGFIGAPAAVFIKPTLVLGDWGEKWRERPLFSFPGSWQFFCVLFFDTSRI